MTFKVRSDKVVKLPPSFGTLAQRETSKKFDYHETAIPESLHLCIPVDVLAHLNLPAILIKPPNLGVKPSWTLHTSASISQVLLRELSATRSRIVLPKFLVDFYTTKFGR